MQTTLRAIYAHLSCADLERSAAWFAALLGRPAEARPMPGLAEWHHGEASGMQLFEDRGAAGHGTLTLIVGDVRAERARLQAAGLEAGAVEEGETVTILRLRDPDGNLVVLAQPGGGPAAGDG